MEKQPTVRIHKEGKIDIHQRALKFQRYLDAIKVDDSMNQDNKQLILDFIRDCSLGKTIKGRAKKKIGPARCLKYLGFHDQQLMEDLGGPKRKSPITCILKAWSRSDYDRAKR